MLVLIAYDICTKTKEDRRRLKKIATVCQNHGIRVQKSLFECSIPFDRFQAVRNVLLDLVDPLCDGLRFYMLGDPPSDDPTGIALSIFEHSDQERHDPRIQTFGREPEIRHAEAILS